MDLSIRLGFVGVGRWARKLAESFRACGAEIVWHVRKSPDPMPGFGALKTSQDIFCGPLPSVAGYDAIVCTADPETTTWWAMRCAEFGIPVMATKPLFDHPERIMAPFYMDTWRMWGDRWEHAKRVFWTAAHSARSRTFSQMPRLDFILEGNGPVRSFPGTFDYGPHLPAFLFDAFPGVEPQIRWAKRLGWESSIESIEAELMMGDVPVGLRYGSAAETGRREIIMSVPGDKRVIWDEPTTYDKSHEIQAFCCSFLSDCAERHVDDRLLRFSREGMALLKRIREEAT